MKKALVKIKKTFGTPLAVVGVNGGLCMLERVEKKTVDSLAILWSIDGLSFSRDSRKVSIEISASKKEKIKLCDRFSLSRTPNGYVMMYVRKSSSKVKSKSKYKTKNTEKNTDKLVIARSKDLYTWQVKSELPVETFHRATIAYDKPLDAFELYTDGLFVRVQSSTTLSIWKNKSALLFTSRNDNFDSDKISIIGSLAVQQGILLLYDAKVTHKNQTLLQVGATLFDINDPKRIIWRAEAPVWQGVVETNLPRRQAGTEKTELYPIGFIYLNDKFMIYWTTSQGNLIIATVPALFKELEDAQNQPKIMHRFKDNPIIEPRHDHHWEGEGTFNPTVVQDDEGIVHLLYRAIDSDGISRIGYARSKDGTHFTNRSPHPVFEATLGTGIPDPRNVIGPMTYNPDIYISGGGWGGAEDPRAVKIDDKIYMMYMAFEGWDSMRIALTSISVDDFKAGKWHWKKPKMISPPGQRNKNWLLFPEKINGKYAILHSIVPEILVDYIDDIDNFKGYISSPRLEGPQPGRRGYWDSFLKGSGPPPVKTDLGWLLLYHALDKRDYGRYKLGAMILDKDNPTKILYRSSHPILSPDMHYENNGKPGIVYASGATIRGDDLYIYYGGGDKVVCVATTPLKEFLKYLVSGNPDSYELNKVSV